MTVLDGALHVMLTVMLELRAIDAIDPMPLLNDTENHVPALSAATSISNSSNPMFVMVIDVDNVGDISGSIDPLAGLVLIRGAAVHCSVYENIDGLVFETIVMVSISGTDQDALLLGVHRMSIEIDDPGAT